MYSHELSKSSLVRRVSGRLWVVCDFEWEDHDVGRDGSGPCANLSRVGGKATEQHSKSQQLFRRGRGEPLTSALQRLRVISIAVQVIHGSLHLGILLQKIYKRFETRRDCVNAYNSLDWDCIWRGSCMERIGVLVASGGDVTSPLKGFSTVVVSSLMSICSSEPEEISSVTRI